MIDQIREFVRVADEGSFSRAAASLNMTQPALSKHIAALEKRVGAQLLDRSNVRTTLTPVGRVFYDDAQEVLQACDLALEHVREFARQPQLSLVAESFVGYPPSDDLLAALDADIRRSRRPITVARRDITTRSGLDDVREGEADLALVSHLADADLSGLASMELVSDPFVAIVRNDHPLAARDAISMADIGSEVVWTYRSPGVRTYFGSMEQTLLGHGANPRFMPLPWTNARDLYSSFAFFEGGIHVNLNSVVRHSVPLAMQGYKVLRFTDPDARLMMFAHWRDGDENPAIPLALESLRASVARMGDDPYGR